MQAASRKEVYRDPLPSSSGKPLFHDFIQLTDSTDFGVAHLFDHTDT